jgi:fructose 1,6-bisphosphatase
VTRSFLLALGAPVAVVLAIAAGEPGDNNAMCVDQKSGMPAAGEVAAVAFADLVAAAARQAFVAPEIAGPQFAAVVAFEAQGRGLGPLGTKFRFAHVVEGSHHIPVGAAAAGCGLAPSAL